MTFQAPSIQKPLHRTPRRVLWRGLFCLPVTPLLSTAPKISAALLTNLYILWYPDAVNAQLRQQLCGTKCSYQLRGITLRWRPWRGVIWGACLRASPAPFSAGNRERRIYFARSMRVCNSVKIRRRKKRGNFLKFSPRFFKKIRWKFPRTAPRRFFAGLRNRAKKLRNPANA